MQFFIPWQFILRNALKFFTFCLCYTHYLVFGGKFLWEELSVSEIQLLFNAHLLDEKWQCCVSTMRIFDWEMISLHIFNGVVWRLIQVRVRQRLLIGLDITSYRGVWWEVMKKSDDYQQVKKKTWRLVNTMIYRKWTYGKFFVLRSRRAWEKRCLIGLLIEKIAS